MAKAKTAEEFDRRFDEGEDIFDIAEIDPEKIKRPGLETKRINVDIPADVLKWLDAHATRRGVSRQSLIKVWLYERIQSESLGQSAFWTRPNQTSGFVMGPMLPENAWGLIGSSPTDEVKARKK